jgi:quercetin dioxygenase-like cupin family protein
MHAAFFRFTGPRSRFSLVSGPALIAGCSNKLCSKDEAMQISSIASLFGTAGLALIFTASPGASETIRRADLNTRATAKPAGDLERVQAVFERAIPTIPGKRLTAVVVNYPPGGKSLSHRHAPSAFIYAFVLSGAIRSAIGSDAAKIYHAGDSFYEEPGAHHKVSENASKTKPASLLAIFIVDAGDNPLTLPDANAEKK